MSPRHELFSDRRFPILMLAVSAVCCQCYGKSLRSEAELRAKFQYRKMGGVVTLATAGEPQAVIVVPEGAPPSVVFAGEELKEHLDAMTGGDFHVVRNIPKNGASLVLGDGPASRQAGIDVDKIGRDGYALRTVGNTIYIAGKDDATEKSNALPELKTNPFPRTASRYEMERRFGAATWDFERGTLYGAYRFLEELGVRWFFPGTKGVSIPKKPNIAVEAFSLQEEPVFDLRMVGRETWQWYLLDSAGNTMNREEYEELGWGGDAVRWWLLRMRGSSEWFAFNHRPPRMELEERYGKEHPEYFALLENGERDLKPQPGRTGHLCYTHPGVLDITKRDIDAYFVGRTGEDMGISSHNIRLNSFNRGWPSGAIYGRTVSLLPHDSFRACCCANCAPFIHEDGNHSGAHSELVWQFIEKMATWMEEQHPDKLITCLAYASYTQKPALLTSLPNNVVVGLCPADNARTHNDVDPAEYAKLMNLVRTWSQVNDRPMLIWLHHLYRHRAPRRQGVPMLLTNLFGKMFREMAEHANLMHVELDADSILLEHLNRYVMLKILYNPYLDAEELVADYTRSFYGPGAETVLSVLKDVEARSCAVAGTQAGSVDVWEKHFTEEAVGNYRRQADELIRITQGTPHEEPARLFSKFFVGEIEKGRALYVRDVKEVSEAKGSSVSIRQLVGQINIDGILDEEGWKRSAVLSFVNNLNGEKTQWKTELRLLRAPEHLYFSFKCFDPNAANLSQKMGEADSVEIFLDSEHNHDNYYWMWIDLGGRIEDWRFEGMGEPPDKSWHSNARFVSRQYADHWVVEVELPRKSIGGGTPDPVGRPWGANFCRSAIHPPRPEDMFSCWSPLLRGKFHQPDLFAHIFFVK